jgi:predicted phosphoribosyltransferase
MDKLVDMLLKRIKSLEDQVLSCQASQDFEAIKQHYLNLIEGQLEPVVAHFK